jgi:hypothetical protein
MTEGFDRHDHDTARRPLHTPRRPHKPTGLTPPRVRKPKPQALG